MANRRAEYQRLQSELEAAVSADARRELQSALKELVVEDLDYARGLFEDSLRRALKFISTTVGRNSGRSFSLAVEIHSYKGDPVVLLGASFLPKVGDDAEALARDFGLELYDLARLKGFDWLIEELAVNGESIAPPVSA